MQNEIEEKIFLEFYHNTVSDYSVAMKTAICKELEHSGKITFEDQMSLNDTEKFPVYFQNKKNIEEIIRKTTLDKRFSGFYENWEFIKLYKYSVPLFFKCKDSSLGDILKNKNIKEFDGKDQGDRVLPIELGGKLPVYKKIGDKECIIKFVLQKSYPDLSTMEQIDYRYPIVIYLNIENEYLEIRYDSVKYNSKYSSNVYEDIVEQAINWLKDVLCLDLFEINHDETINILKDNKNEAVKIYKQMMELSSGGSAELTAARDQDYLLPFIGEIRELISENESLFTSSPEVKDLIEQYLNDKEATANYPYIYVSWENAVASQSYIVKITFDYLQRRHTVLQHLTGTCKDLKMERMNNAIKYLCRSGSFTKGAEI